MATTIEMLFATRRNPVRHGPAHAGRGMSAVALESAPDLVTDRAFAMTIHRVRSTLLRWVAAQQERRRRFDALVIPEKDSRLLYRAVSSLGTNGLQVFDKQAEESEQSVRYQATTRVIVTIGAPPCRDS